MICRANQLTDFYMMANLAFNEFRLNPKKRLTVPLTENLFKLFYSLNQWAVITPKMALAFHILNISCCKGIVPNNLKHLTLFVEVKQIYLSLAFSFFYIFLSILLEYLNPFGTLKKTCLNMFCDTLNHHYYCHSYCCFHHYYHCYN